MKKVVVRESVYPDYDIYYPDEFFKDVIMLENRNFEGQNMDLYNDIEDYLFDSELDEDLILFRDEPFISEYNSYLEIFDEYLGSWIETEEQAKKAAEVILSDMTVEEIRLQLINVITGHTHTERVLRGYSQSDWIDVIYPDTYATSDIEYLENLFFGLGIECSITEDDDESTTYYNYFMDEDDLKRYCESEFPGASVYFERLEGFVQVPKFSSEQIA